jgi:hypothetical protein
MPIFAQINMANKSIAARRAGEKPNIYVLIRKKILCQTK